MKLYCTPKLEIILQLEQDIVRTSDGNGVLVTPFNGENFVFDELT